MSDSASPKPRLLSSVASVPMLDYGSPRNAAASATPAIAEEEAAPLKFEKKLDDDLSAASAFDLLVSVASGNELFCEFTKEDLQTLSEMMSNLVFQPGDKVITKGEHASFCGISLKGTFDVIVSESLTVPLSAGSLIGEMAVFEKSTRTADIYSATETYLAVISFEELENIHLINPELHWKFMKMLAVASIRKLRSMTEKKYNFQPGENKENKSDSKDSTPKPGLASSQSASAKSIGATEDFNQKHKLETLYLQRIKKKAETTEKLLEIEHKEREKNERMRRNILYNKMNLDKKVRDQAKEIESLSNRIAELNVNIKKYRLEIAKQGNLINALQDEKSNNQKQLNEQNVTMKETADKLAKLEVEYKNYRYGNEGEKMAQFASIEELQAKINEVQTDNERLKAGLEKSEQTAASLAQEKTRILNERSQLQEAVKSTESERNMLQQKQNEALSQVHYLAECKRDLESQLAEYRMKSDEYLNELKNRTAKYESAIAAMQRDQYSIIHTHDHYRSLIKVLSMKNYVKNFRIRKTLLDIHSRVSGLITQRLDLIPDTDSQGISKGDTAAKAQYVGYELLDASYNEENSTNLNFLSKTPNNQSDNDFAYSLNSPGGAASETPTAAVDPWSHQALKKEKKAKLLYLKESRAPIAKLIESLDEEVNELKYPIEKLHYQTLEMKLTIDSFFKRNVQLVNQCLAAKKQLELVKGKMVQFMEEKQAMAEKLQVQQWQQAQGMGMPLNIAAGAHNPSAATSPGFLPGLAKKRASIDDRSNPPASPPSYSRGTLTSAGRQQRQITFISRAGDLPPTSLASPRAKPPAPEPPLEEPSQDELGGGGSGRTASLKHRIQSSNPSLVLDHIEQKHFEGDSDGSASSPYQVLTFTPRTANAKSPNISTNPYSFAFNSMVLPASPRTAAGFSQNSGRVLSVPKPTSANDSQTIFISKPAKTNRN